MKISEVKNVLRVGRIVLGTKPTRSKKYVLYNTGLCLDYDVNFPKSLKRKKLSIVYLFVVNGEIRKIGQTSGVSGISGCMGFYTKAGMDDPGFNRFAINKLFREELDKGSSIEVYMMYEEPITAPVKGLFSSEVADVMISAKAMEDLCIRDFVSVENCHPMWNFQESGIPLPSYIHTSFGDYKTKRGEDRE